eukprot:5661443-Alexandrium_andersonii.AAC.1
MSPLCGLGPAEVRSPVVQRWAPEAPRFALRLRIVEPPNIYRSRAADRAIWPVGRAGAAT